MRGASGAYQITISFQSAPGREAGRCVGGVVGLHAVIGFNPRPAVRPGDAVRLAGAGFRYGVSIRARP